MWETSNKKTQLQVSDFLQIVYFEHRTGATQNMRIITVSGNNMKIAFLTTLSFLSSVSFAQQSRIDSLIEKLDNSQIGFSNQTMGYRINVRGEAPLAIAAIGKPATPKLVESLSEDRKSTRLNSSHAK